MTTAQDGGKVVGLKHRPLYPQEIQLVLISFRDRVDPKAIVRPEGLCHWKILMTLSGIEPATCRLWNKPEKITKWEDRRRNLICLCIFVYWTIFSIVQINWQMAWYVANNGLGSTWKEAVVAYFEKSHWHKPGVTTRNHEKTQLRWPTPRQQINPVIPKYEAGVPTTRPWHSVRCKLVYLLLSCLTTVLSYIL
jgi:hypothetical protein